MEPEIVRSQCFWKVLKDDGIIDFYYVVLLKLPSLNEERYVINFAEGQVGATDDCKPMEGREKFHVDTIMSGLANWEIARKIFEIDTDMHASAQWAPCILSKELEGLIPAKINGLINSDGRGVVKVPTVKQIWNEYVQELTK